MATYDIIVIGAGPGGYPAAIHAAHIGAKVALIEQADMGGVCLNSGCIPSKILLRDAYILSMVKKMQESGRVRGELTPDFPAIVAHSRERVETLREGLPVLIEQNDVEIIQGTARVSGPGTVTVETDGEKTTHTAEKGIIIATGSRASTIPPCPIDEKQIITSREALALDELPSSLAIVGGGVIGCEMATFFSALGTQVIIIESLDRLLPTVDKDISRALKQSFTHRGIEVHTSCKVTAATLGEKSVVLSFKSRGKEELKSLKAEKVLIATGIMPNSELFEGTVEMDDERFILVDPTNYQTSVEGVYAIGDVIQPRDRPPHPALAHVASAEAELAVKHILSGKTSYTIDYTNVPVAIFTDPEIGSVGLTLEEAQQRWSDRQNDFVEQKVPDSVMGITTALEMTGGMEKIIVDTSIRGGAIIGAHIIGPAATERVHTFAESIVAGDTVTNMAQQMMAHPTFSEFGHETLCAYLKCAVHVPYEQQGGRKRKS